ncbi:MAG: murein L,D-transpeptidase catalytic domain family protein [Lachnospiraceae bacterium]|nr:murein L,D-transpeptidase catalytic domain family protein [Lachnospiraceae bacterium]
MKKPLLILTSLATLLLPLLLIIGHSTPKDLDERAEEALEYCKENGSSTEYCLLVDYGRHSGRVRFFIWDFEKEKPVLKSLCAHGYGKGSTARKPVFSNEPGSFCSSLGHYKVGKEKVMGKPKGRKALVLYGKDKTNSNALQRGILIHPVSLPNFPIYPLLIPVKVHKVLGYKIRPKSEGCITIPFRKYAKVSDIVKSSSRPVLLWVYE